MLRYPFSAIVGQEEMKLALLLSAVSREVAGVLLCGEKGTGKSTAARALASLLPEVGPGQKAPFVNLPLNATEEALLGTIDLEETFRTGRPIYSPGLLVKADQGVLYIDEVNLLPEHLAASLLDVAERGLVVVEREGLSLTLPARLVLIGSMNPEEGDLSSQLLDRFGLCVMVSGEKDPQRRVEVVKRRLLFERDPEAFERLYEKEEKALRERLLKARSLYPQVVIPVRFRVLIGELCREARVSGHRADLVLQAAARAYAALHGREEVLFEDIEAVAEMVLVHRRREQEPRAKSPEKEPREDKESKKGEKRIDSPPELREDSRPRPPEREASEEKEGSQASLPPPPEEVKPHEGQDQVFEIGEVFEIRPLGSTRRRKAQEISGKRLKSLTQRGRFVRAIIPRGKVRDLALSATLRAAAPYQLRRGAGPGRGVVITKNDFREKQRKSKVGHLLLFCVDASGSMAAEARMRETKGAIMSLLLSAYQKRDRVALIVFRGKEAKLVLPPTNSVELAGRLLTDLPVGGSTPLPAALSLVVSFLERALRREPELPVTTFFITDGRGNVSLGQDKPQEEIRRWALILSQRFPQVDFVVVDTETGFVRLEMAKELARILSAKYFTPEALKAERLVRIARDLRMK